LTTLHSFVVAGGMQLFAGLIQATDGNFYGTTGSGGAYGYGTVFMLTPSGTLTTLHSFDGTDGAYPCAGLIQGTDESFYGTTSGKSPSSGGASGYGTVFKITRSGTLTTLHRFNGTDGSVPYPALLQATDGNFYGTTSGLDPSSSGALGDGTVFKITPSGSLTTLHRFNGTDGSLPLAGLIQATDGNLYGTTRGGNGTVFRMTPSGTLTTLHDFDGADGAGPFAGLIQATDGNFYGTTFGGGSYGWGTVFKITPSGTLTTLHDFELTDGTYARAVIQATDGNFYGATGEGGSWGAGTVFKLSADFGPLVTLTPTYGHVGATAYILGNNLTGTTSVSFNGVAAKFAVLSSSKIRAIVPAGATTGTVRVVTPDGTLESNVPFQVTPQTRGFTPISGPVGTVVTIAGIALTQTTAVTFGGVEATSFTVVSDREVQATVPAGAKTGHIAITTAGGTVTTCNTFTVD
jgi:uncharacterized repeat protein (TIGR03803 family)